MLDEEDDEDKDDEEEGEILFEIEIEDEEDELTLEAIYESVHENQNLIEQLHVLLQLLHLEVKKVQDLIKEKKNFHFWN